MGKNSGIAWTHHTFSPWHGCVEVSPACDHCYARRWDARFFHGDDAHWGKESPRRFFGDKHWNEPRKWDRDAKAKFELTGERTYVFCASMSDVFESGRPDLMPHRMRLWGLITDTPNLTWLLLTKRPQNISKLITASVRDATNVWYGTTIESPQYLWRAEALCDEARHAPVRFVSMEPYLEPTDIRGHLGSIDWVITGCESGEGARHTPTDWYRELRDWCQTSGTYFFFKQAPKGAEGITAGEGSYEKRDLRTSPDGMKRVHYIIEKPYLDGRQWVEWPT